MSNLKKIFLALTARERLAFWVSLFFLAVSATVLAAVGIGKATTIVPATGGEYTEGMVGQPTSVNPVLAATEADRDLVRLIFSNLYELADKREAEKNGKTWNVRLKENVTWSDKRKITSDDVIFTVERIQDPATQSPSFTSWQGVTVRRVSELEMQFNLVTPYPFFAQSLKDLFIIPKHLFAETPSSNWRLSEYTLKPVGSGPYEFESYRKEQNGFISEYRLTANTRHFGDKPFIPRFTVRFFPSSDELIKAFNAGFVDGFADFDPETVAKINRPHQSLSFYLPRYYAVFFNQGQHIALKEEEVRKALGLAADREAIVEEVFEGKAAPVDTPMPSRRPEAAGGTTFAKEKAEELLEAGGWKRGEDGVREKAVRDAKIRLEFDLTVPDIPFLVATGEMLKRGWEEIGARANLIVLSPDEVASRVIKNREYHALLFGNELNPSADLYSFWHSNERFYPGLNLALYNSKQADRLIESIRVNFDEGERAKQLEELRLLIASDSPAVFLYSPDHLYLTTKELKGVEARFLAEPADRLSGASRWYLRTARALK